MTGDIDEMGLMAEPINVPYQAPRLPRVVVRFFRAVGVAHHESPKLASQFAEAIKPQPTSTRSEGLAFRCNRGGRR